MEISANFFPRTVYVAGDKVQCTIEFKLKKAQEICIGWASAQLQCECVIASKGSGKVSNSLTQSINQCNEKSDFFQTRTSFRSIDWLEGDQFMSSSPKLLFCELVLNKENHSNSFVFSENLPFGIPPSFKGKYVKIIYHLLIGAQVLNSSIQVVKLPFRVLTSPLEINNSYFEIENRNSVRVSNPFLQNPRNGNFYHSKIFQNNYGVVNFNEKSSSIFDISIPLGHIAKLIIPKKRFKLGEEILINILFPLETAIKCMQYSASLISEEEILDTNIPTKFRQTPIRKFQDFTLGYEESFVKIEIPFYITPSFTSSVCSLNWNLYFEFVIFNSNGSHLSYKELQSEWNAPQKLDVQTLEWTFPISIYSSDPMHLEWFKTNSSNNDIPKTFL